MNPYAAHLLAAINITEETKARYPLGNVIDVTTGQEKDKITIIIAVQKDEETSKAEASVPSHPSFLKRQEDETSVKYVFGVPVETRTAVQLIIDKSEMATQS